VQTDKLGYIFGIDVSDYQENVDWKKVADSGVSFAYLKATEGGSFRTEIFEPYRKAARENGIITGAYHFFQPAVPAHLQAENFLAKIGKLEADDLPPALDLEDPAIWTGFSRKEKITMVLTWLKTVEAKTGVRPIIYTGPTFMEDVLHSAPELAKYDLWLAHYTSDKSPSLPHSFSKWQLWQYSDQGNIAGVEGGVDMNRFAGDKSQLLALGRTSGNVLPSQGDLVASALVAPGAKSDQDLSASKATPKQPNQDDGIISFDVANL
jgi:lysozyme